jgi:hypothetical protein
VIDLRTATAQRRASPLIVVLHTLTFRQARQ